MVWLIILLSYVLLRTYLYYREKNLPGGAQAGQRYRRSMVIMITINLALLGVLLALEKKMVYHPSSDKEYWSPPAGLAFEDVFLKSTLGDTIHAWWCAEPHASMTLLFSHGNAGNLSGHAWLIPALRRWYPCNVLIYDYPGFGKSTGTPSEAGCYAAAQAAQNWLTETAHIPTDKLIYLGQSLGCAMACELAVTREHRGLILLSPFTTIRDRGQEILSILPVRWLMSHHYDNKSKLQQYHKPLLIAHGTRDEVIPFHHGKQLFEAAASREKTFITLPNATHKEVPDEFFKAVEQFLSKLTPSTK
ncbi:MAG TPA: alpha/beta hydrolase [Gemmatales bacterium]|nr:alpha/beta hydrolase [Gemmatales bacterium]